MAVKNLGLLGSHIAFEIDKTARGFLEDNFEDIDLRGSVRERGSFPVTTRFSLAVFRASLFRCSANRRAGATASDAETFCSARWT